MDDRSPYPFVTREPEAGETTLYGDAWVKTAAYAVGALAFLATLGTLSFVAFERYMEIGKTAEATNTIGQLSKLQVEVYEIGHEEPTLGRSLCKSAPHAVPKSMADVKGHTYSSLDADWHDGAADQGFRCLRFEKVEPQWYRYDFSSTGPQGRFTALAAGDIDGDGVNSELSHDGYVDPDRRTIVLEPKLRLSRPDE
jgi:hypothetical protein